MNLILILIERKKFYHASYFIDNIEKILTYQDMFAIVFFNFLKQTMAHLNGELPNLTIIEDIPVVLVKKLRKKPKWTIL